MVPTGAASSKQIDVNRLDVCTEYWLIARAATCAAEEFSDPFKAELRDVTGFTFSFKLDGSAIPRCEDWLKTQYAQNIEAVESEMMGTMNQAQCGLLQVNCFAGSAFTCNSQKQDTVYFR